MNYIYDSTFDGLMTAVFEIYAAKDSDALISSSNEINYSLYESAHIVTDTEKSNRVQTGLNCLGRDLSARLYTAWLSHTDNVDDLILSVIRIGFSSGKNPMPQRHYDVVCKVDALASKVGGVAHRMLQFVRFIKLSEDLYAADIEPEYDVLALIGDHFHSRFPQNRFIIRDIPRLQAIVSTPDGWHITSLPSDNPPLPKNGTFERLWRTYFKTIANVGRINLKLQQQFVPLKFRKNLTEFQSDHHKEC